MNNKPFSRSERVSQQVLKTINDILTREMDLRKYGFITFSSVKMTASVDSGMECGISVEGVKKYFEGDRIIAYKINEIKRTLADS